MADADDSDEAENDDRNSDGYNDHPPTYPRPGHGLMRTLPVESEDLRGLFEEEDRYGIFNHFYQAESDIANEGLNGG